MTDPTNKSKPKFGGGMEKCTVCLQSVYPMEKMILEGSAIHKNCFKCKYCDRTLTLSNFAAVNGLVYCKIHYVKLFKESGGKYDVFDAFSGEKKEDTIGVPPPSQVVTSQPKASAINAFLSASKPKPVSPPLSSEPLPKKPTPAIHQRQEEEEDEESSALKPMTPGVSPVSSTRSSKFVLDSSSNKRNSPLAKSALGDAIFRDDNFKSLDHDDEDGVNDDDKEQRRSPVPFRQLTRKNSEPNVRASLTSENKLKAFLAASASGETPTKKPPPVPPLQSEEATAENPDLKRVIIVDAAEYANRSPGVADRVKAIANRTSGRVRRMSAPASQLSEGLRRIGSRTQELMRAYIPAPAGTAGHEDTAEPVGIAPAVEAPKTLVKFRLQGSVRDRLKWLESLTSRSTNSPKKEVPLVKKGAATEAKLRYLSALAQSSERVSAVAAMASPLFSRKSSSTQAKAAEYLAAASPSDQSTSPNMSPLFSRADAKSAYLAALQPPVTEKRPFESPRADVPFVKKPAPDLSLPNKQAPSRVTDRVKALEPLQPPPQASPSKSVAARAKEYETEASAPFSKPSGAGAVDGLSPTRPLSLVRERAAAIQAGSANNKFSPAAAAPAAAPVVDSPQGVKERAKAFTAAAQRVPSLSRDARQEVEASSLKEKISAYLEPKSAVVDAPGTPSTISEASPFGKARSVEDNKEVGKGSSLLRSFNEGAGLRRALRAQQPVSSAEDGKQQVRQPEKPQEKPQEKHQEKQQEKHQEKQQEKHQEKQQVRQPEKPQEKQQEKHQEKQQEKHQEKQQEKHLEKPQEKHQEKQQEKHHEKQHEEDVSKNSFVTTSDVDTSASFVTAPENSSTTEKVVEPPSTTLEENPLASTNEQEESTTAESPTSNDTLVRKSSLVKGKNSFSNKKKSPERRAVSFGMAEFHEILQPPPGSPSSSATPPDEEGRNLLVGETVAQQEAVEEEQSSQGSQEDDNSFKTSSGAKARRGSALAAYLNAMEEARKSGRPAPVSAPSHVRGTHNVPPDSPPPQIPPSPPIRHPTNRYVGSRMVLEEPGSDGVREGEGSVKKKQDEVIESLGTRVIIAPGKRRRPSSSRLLKGTSLDDMDVKIGADVEENEKAGEVEKRGE